MASSPDHISMALFCDFENVALGVRDANYEKFDIKKVLERLLLKGSIVVKKAYCDWERYKGFKAAMHEANFELIEIPHVRQSGKNSADIRLVVDALDLCYTKSHVNTFVIISGDSDFSPLVSKLRENAKYVIGVGVKQSTSDLLIANCDEFIFYDDLVRDAQRQRRDNRDQPQPRRSPEEEARRKAELDARRTKAVEMAVETFDALVTDRDEGGKIWASVLKEAIKRRNPGFNENYYGFRTFGNLLEEAKSRGLLEFGRDEKSSAYVFRSAGNGSVASEMRAPQGDTIAALQAERSLAADEDRADLASAHEGTLAAPAEPEGEAEQNGAAESRNEERRRSRGGRGRGSRNGGRAERDDRQRAPREARADASAAERPVMADVPAPVVPPPAAPVAAPAVAQAEPAANEAASAPAARKSRSTKPRSEGASRKAKSASNATESTPVPEVAPAQPEAAAPAPAAKRARRPAARKQAARKASPASAPDDAS
ncbi:NYN domain-containing protein [uncultured Aquabacterium sp.]|uniref:NYN domain-containing protein n=1 Tax=uncultured Aquabacterium sp. TaxID=158753 RepID=UPI002615552A|nr:NYN domain-containing protein [uncultured Aquabacterium sp.]